ncbi:2-amino-3-ketobutyrate coenzyme A ligase [Coxiella-like endosymbiont]|nr:glycine C-acetyltransferase [Coxiella endosymbiont of Rhipicephalus microplus]PMB54348.1 2-amino-3-ketobutyrate coenzyme A ligase [Coxiella-like endosymbiont]
MQEILNQLYTDIENLKKLGLYKTEQIITSPQNTNLTVRSQYVLNFCSNNYLGLADHFRLIKVGQKALEQYGFGMASVRFICGTHNIHKKLEKNISHFLGMEDTILYSSCFDANGGLFETLLGPEDGIISDELNHASIIDGIRLCKAQCYRYKNNDMKDLEMKLREANEKGVRYKLIATDGVFSMDGIIANLKCICELAHKYNAYVMVDDSHAVGLIGENGRGTPEYCGVMNQVDILTGTLGKALGGASGGYTSGRKEIIEYLRIRSRPYLFSNSVAPVIVATSLEVLELLKTEGKRLRQQLQQNSQYFRSKIEKLGFQLVPGNHPIIPVMLGDAELANNMADQLFKEGIYVIAFSYPVVPMNKARIRVQISAIHIKEQLDRAINAFERVGKKIGVI